MAITLAAVRRGLDDMKLKYSEIDSTTIALITVGKHARLQVVVSLEENGEYIRMRTIGMATCTREHPNFARIMAEVADANYKYSTVAFGWDKSDGEIAGEVCLPLEDNSNLTNTQIRTLYGLLVVGCDLLFETLEPLVGRQERTSLASSSAKPISTSTRSAPSVSSSRPSTPTPSGGGQQRQTSGMLAFGVLLIGVAAVAGVAWLFLH